MEPPSIDVPTEPCFAWCLSVLLIVLSGGSSRRIVTICSSAADQDSRTAGSPCQDSGCALSQSYFSAPTLCIALASQIVCRSSQQLCPQGRSLPAEKSDATVAFRMQLNAFVIGQCVFCGLWSADKNEAEKHADACRNCEK